MSSHKSDCQHIDYRAVICTSHVHMEELSYLDYDIYPLCLFRAFDRVSTLFDMNLAQVMKYVYGLLSLLQ